MLYDKLILADKLCCERLFVWFMKLILNWISDIGECLFDTQYDYEPLVKGFQVCIPVFRYHFGANYRLIICGDLTEGASWSSYH